jgi:hypothetical protein
MDFVIESLIICYTVYKCLELYLNYKLTIKNGDEESETQKTEEEAQ